MFSALEVFFYENALYKFTIDIDIDIDNDLCSSAVRIVLIHFESNRIVIVSLKSHQQ